MRYVKAFGQFWYDFIIGDDWKVAASVVVGLSVSALFVRAGTPDGIVCLGGGFLILALWLLALAGDVRTHRRTALADSAHE